MYIKIHSDQEQKQ